MGYGAVMYRDPINDIIMDNGSVPNKIPTDKIGLRKNQLIPAGLLLIRNDSVICFGLVYGVIWYIFVIWKH
jgi:hypothetical protein